VIIGGAKLYAEALPQATRLYLTEIDRDIEQGDTFLHLDRSHWRETSRRAGHEAGVTFVELTRIEGS
jgi:dihydrofolate reductase